jgi:NAD-dependent deacetylase
LWRQFRPESLGTPDAFRKDPQLVWEWYDWRRQIIKTKKPNAAHDVLAAWSTRFPQFTLITQNVDGLHERAGTKNVIRFHGSIWEVSCWNRCSQSPATWENTAAPLPQIPPECPYCGSLIRPGVVWFGESIDPHVIQRSVDALDCDVFFVIGTSSLVYPAAGLVSAAKERGVFTVELNLEPTPASNVVDVAVHGPADELLSRLESEYLGMHGDHS